MQPKYVYQFGPYRIDPALSRLLRGGAPVPLPPKAFDLLLFLARNPKRLLPKAELMGALWPDTFVEDANLTQHVFTLRKALGTQENGEPYIQTVPRRGYCFAADVREAVEAEAPQHAGRERATEPPRASIHGERKQATVLHCGIANAAALAERLGPAALDEVLGRLSELAADEIGRYEGIVRQRHADEFVALFGARIVHEDDTRRAVLAAIGIRRRLGELVADGTLADTADERLMVRIGINTGPVIVSRRADDRGVEYSAVGETMRVAYLLQQLGAPDTILISEAARRAVEGYVQVEPAAIDARVAGTPAFRVVGVAPGAEWRLSRLTRTLARFVGRRHELGLLKDLTEQALAGKGQAVNVVGEPGMGKSRLVHEFSQAVSEGDRVGRLEGRCVSYGSLVPYLPLADLIRTHCGVRESDSPETIRAAVERAVRNTELPADAVTWLLRLIGIVDTASALETLSPEAIKARTFDVLRSLLLQASLRSPLLIIVEDVHWIDRTSEEFLTTLIERLAAARVMFVATYRPGYRAPWMDRSYVTQVTLTPLTPADSAELVGSMDRWQRLTTEVAAAILTKAEGNPFFLEELARAAVEHGAETHGIPDTVHGVIMARIDRLPDSAKELLQTASVLGRETSRRLLTRVRGGGTEVDADLMELCRLEFLFERPGGQEPLFVFKHALTQDVAYDSLLARRRRDLHVEAARALEELYGDRLDEITATLAYHYARTELIEEAVTWLMRAADRAAQVYANAEAILHLDLARRRLERLPEGPERDRRALEIALQQTHSLYFLGRWKESVGILLSHETRSLRLNDPGLTGMLFFWLGHMYTRLGDQPRGAECAHRAIDAATRANDEATLGRAHGVLSQVGFWSGNTKDGITHGKISARVLGARPDQRWWLGMTHFYLAINYLEASQFEKALAAAARADSVGREIGDPRLQTYAGYTTGWIEASRGRTDVAIAACRTSLEKAPDRVSRAYASLFLGFSLLHHGEHAEALERLQAALMELEGFEFPQWQSLAAVLIAECLRLKGQPEDADKKLRRGLEIATGVGYWYAVGVGERVAARTARDSGRTSEAAAAFARAVDTFERIGATFEAARTRAEAH